MQQDCTANVTLERRIEVKKRTAINYKNKLKRFKQSFIKQGAKETKRKYEGEDQSKDAPITEEDQSKDVLIEPRVLRSGATYRM